MAMTVEQQKAIAIAQARAKAAQVAAPQSDQSWAGTAEDMGKSALAGIGRGITGLAGLPGTIGNAFDSSVSAITGIPAPRPSPLSGEGLQSGLSAITGGAADYQPQTTAGKYAGTVGEFLPGAALTGGLGAGNLTRFGVLPGVASEGAGQLTQGTSAEPYARVAAALIAPALPALASTAISPFSGAIPQARMDAVNTLVGEGVQPTAGQITGSRALRFAESELGGAATRNIMDEQGQAFTNAATARAGQQGLATPDNMLANAQRLGQGFQDISARNVVAADPQFNAELGGVLTEYNRVLPTAQREVVNNLANDIGDVINNNAGTIPGDIYQQTRSRLSRMAQSARNSDPEYSNALRGMRNALDNAMTRSVAPADAAEWAQLRNQYGNMRTLERASTGAGEAAGVGIISPAKLRQAATTGRQSGFARGQGDFDQLAKAGQAVLTPLPDSGTASRLAVRGLMSTPAAAGAIVGGSTGDVISGLMGAAAGAAVPALAGRALMSGPVQRYIVNQLAPNLDVLDPRTLAVIQGLTSHRKQK